MINLTISLARIPIGISCKYKRNIEFFEEYLTTAPPVFSVAPSPDDLRYSEEMLRRQAQHDGVAPSCSPGLVENHALHFLIAEKMAEYGVLLMHGSAIVLDGECYIFTAPSGTGKSTHTRLWREQFGDRAWMLNDDKPMLAVREGEVIAWGTPWNGKHRLGRNAAAPLRGIAWLRRDTKNHIEPLSREEAFPVLYQQIYRAMDPAHMSAILAMEQQLLHAVPCYKLGCNMQPQAAIVSYEGMKGADK